MGRVDYWGFLAFGVRRAASPFNHDGGTHVPQGTHGYAAGISRHADPAGERMMCPACRAADSRVLRTVKSSENFRERACPCGKKWQTVEKIIQRTIKDLHGVFREQIPEELTRFILSRDGNACQYCGRSDVKLGIDHVVPVSAAIPPGLSRDDETRFRNSAANMVACCVQCNSSKGDKVDGKRMGEKYERRRKLDATNSDSTALLGATDGDIQQKQDISFISGSDLDLTPDPIRSDLTPLVLSNPDPERAHVSATRRNKRVFREYEKEFDVLWEGIQSNRSKGLKSEAFEAWIKAGKPPAIMILNKWREYVASLGETSAKDVCRWLKWGGHLETYVAAPPRLAASPVDRRPQWQREREAQGQREAQASVRYHERQAAEKSTCGYHLYNGEDARFVLEECPRNCTHHGRDLDGNPIKVQSQLIR